MVDRRTENTCLLKNAVEKIGEIKRQATGWTAGVLFPARAMKGCFSLRHCVHTGSVIHPASYPMDSGGSFPGGKAAEA
jgi:hypothetical protein